MLLLRLAGFVFRDTWRDFSRHKSLFLLAALSLATGLFVSGGGLLGIDTLDRWVAKMGSMAKITVFAAEGADINALQRQLADDPRFTSIRQVSSQDATKQLLESVKDAGLMLEMIGGDAIPPSLELTLREDLLDRRKALDAGEGLRKIKGVGDVVVDHERLETLLKGARAIRGGLAGFGVLLLLVSAFSTATVVRMGIMSRDEEINIMRLVGATESFILAPLLLEGALLGLLGAAAAIGGLYLLWLPLSLGKIDVSPFIAELAKLAFFSPKSLGILAATGMATGAIGALFGFQASKGGKKGE